MHVMSFLAASPHGLDRDCELMAKHFVAFSSVPEPGSLALLGLGMTLVAGYSVRRARSRRPQA